MSRFFLVAFYLFAGGVLAAVYNSPSKKITGKANQSQAVDYSSSVYHPFVIPIYVVLMPIMMWLLQIFSVYDFIYGIMFPMFFEFTLYYSALIVFAPFIRKKLRSKACAALWILPNLMYVAYTHPGYRVQPDYVVVFDHRLALGIMIVWFVGFICTMCWYVFSHLRFRKDVLKDAKQCWDDETLAIWFEELEDSGFKIRKETLLVSDKLTSPLTIGLYKSTIRVILPKKKYTEEQLRLILRHELVHLTKNDNITKFFFAFCNSLCWFSPLMWKAMKQCAEDLERSCDEAVLIDSNPMQRKMYGELILDSGADQRGFTTCLSASAESLRYRLKSIMNPSQLWSGASVLFVVVVMMSFLTGRIAVSYDSAHLDYTCLGDVVSAEVTKHYEDYTPDEVIELETDTDLIDKLSALTVNEVSLMYKGLFSCELCLSVEFEESSRYSLEIAEVGNGLIIQENRPGSGYPIKMYFCEDISLETMKTMLISNK